MDNDLSKKANRHRGQRCDYKEGAGKPKRWRAIRQKGHEMLPRIVGCWFSRSDDPTVCELYCTSMLTLLKPWSNMEDLKLENQGEFDHSWQVFLAGIDKFGKTVVENIQYYHECNDGAKLRWALDVDSKAQTPIEHELGLEEQATNQNNDLSNEVLIFKYTEEDVEDTRVNQSTAKEQLYSESTLDIRYWTGFFLAEPLSTNYKCNARKATIEEQDHIRHLEKQLNETVRSRVDPNINETAPELYNNGVLGRDNAISAHSLCLEPTIEPATGSMLDTANMERPQYMILNSDQRRAHDIVERQLQEHLGRESFSWFWSKEPNLLVGNLQRKHPHHCACLYLARRALENQCLLAQSRKHLNTTSQHTYWPNVRPQELQQATLGHKHYIPGPGCLYRCQKVGIGLRKVEKQLNSSVLKTSRGRSSSSLTKYP